MIYDRIAPYYNRALSRPFFTYLRPVISEILSRHRVAPPANILEVACGPGHLSAYLQERRFRVTGCDLSLMQGTTSPHRNGIPFLVARMQALPFFHTFDAMFNMYDSINHLHSVPDLASTFREAKRLLQPGGLFVFDTNNRTAFTRIWGDPTPYRHEEDDFTLTMETMYSPRERMSRAVVTVKSPKGEIVSDFRERYFTRREIRAGLRETGFTLLEHRPWCPSVKAYRGVKVKDLWVAVA